MKIHCKAIGSVRLSVRRFVSTLSCLSTLVFYMRREWSSSAIESEGHRSQVKGPNTYGRGNAVTQSVWPRSWIEDNFLHSYNFIVTRFTWSKLPESRYVGLQCYDFPWRVCKSGASTFISKIVLMWCRFAVNLLFVTLHIVETAKLRQS